MRSKLSILLFIVGAAVGLKCADVDQPLPFLVHRSILTHGFLIPLLLAYSVWKQRGPTDDKRRSFTLGISLTSAVHLCFDLFPRSWYKHALIHIPFYGWTSALFSIAWILISILVCLYIAFVLVRDMPELLLSMGTLIAAFWVAAPAETHSCVLCAAFVLIPAAFIALGLSYRFAKRS